MNRRYAIRCSLIVPSGIIFLPACLHEKKKSLLNLKNILISGADEKFIEELCNVLIPATSTPGAKDIASHLFVLMMMDDCYGPNIQKKFISGMAQF